jgi:hypothetical protein
MILAGGSVSEYRELKKMTVGEYLQKLDIFAESMLKDH